MSRLLLSVDAVAAEALDEAEQITLVGDRHDLTAVHHDRLADESPLDSLTRQQPEQQGERARPGR